MKNLIQIQLLLIGFMLCVACAAETKEDTKIAEKKKKLALQKEMRALEGNPMEIKLEYIGFLCECPQWAPPEDIERYYEALGTANELSIDSIFMILERKDKSIPFPFKMKEWEGEKQFVFKGQFYKNRRKWSGKDHSKWNSKVFRYESCKIVKNEE